MKSPIRFRGRRLAATAFVFVLGVLGPMASAEEPEYSGTVTVDRVLFIIDGYRFSWDDAQGDILPSPSDQEAAPPSMRPRTIAGLVGIAPGESFEARRLEALALRRQREIDDTQLFFNIQVTVIPNSGDPSRVWLLVDCAAGFSIRPSAGPFFIGWGDDNADGNLLSWSGAIGANYDAFRIGRGSRYAGSSWWSAGADYASTLWLDDPPLHEIGVEASVGSAWLPLSPWLRARFWRQAITSGEAKAPWGALLEPNLGIGDEWRSGNLAMEWKAAARCQLLSYAPSWDPIASPELRSSVKLTAEPLTLAVQGALAWQSDAPFEAYALSLDSDATRAIRVGFADEKEAFADRLAMLNVELRLADCIGFPLWFTSLDFQPYAFLDAALAGDNSRPLSENRALSAKGLGLRLQFGVPVGLCLDFAYGWSADGRGALFFSMGSGF